MDNTSEAIDTVFRVTYMGIAYVFRIVADTSRTAKLAGVMAAMDRRNNGSRSAMEMERLLQQGKGFCQFDIMEKDYKTFSDAAKAADVRFSCVTLDKIHPEGERLFTIFCSPDQADIVNRIIEINELNGVKSADYQQESAHEVTPEEVEAMTKEELRRRNLAKNADFFEQFMDEVQPHAAKNPTILAEHGSAAPSEVWSETIASGRQSVRERVMEIRRNHAAPQPSREEVARNFYEANLKNLSVSTRE